MTDHVHDCTGPDMRCPCGYVFTVPPISVSISVFDGGTELFDDAFNCNDMDIAIRALRKAIQALERRRA